jgi:hypothetical protein
MRRASRSHLTSDFGRAWCLELECLVCLVPWCVVLCAFQFHWYSNALPRPPPLVPRVYIYRRAVDKSGTEARPAAASS